MHRVSVFDLKYQFIFIKPILKTNNQTITKKNPHKNDIPTNRFPANQNSFPQSEFLNHTLELIIYILSLTYTLHYIDYKNIDFSLNKILTIEKNSSRIKEPKHMFPICCVLRTFPEQFVITKHPITVT